MDSEISTEFVDKFTKPSTFVTNSPLQMAIEDLRVGLLKWQTWFLLAYQDIKLKYRRSILGPFWITISMAITVYSMGFLYAHLFRTDIANYYPFLVGGMLGWAFISNAITELTESFTQSESLIKQIKLPYTLYLHRVTTRNFIIFFHNLAVMIPIYLIFSDTAKINLNTLFLIPDLMLIYINCIIYGLILAMVGSRFRDIMQIVRSFIQIVFFVTPIMWTPAILPENKRFLVYLNPFYSYLELIRAPLIGNLPTLFNIGMVLLTTGIGFWVCVKLFVPYRSRIIYWL